jgi:transposase
VEQCTRFVGLDVHAAKIVVAVAASDGSDPRVRGDVPNEPDAVAALMAKLGPASSLRVCFEAGPCGYGIYRQLRALGIDCTVIAPTKIPRRPGDRVKTDRRDAKNLARAHRNGDLVAVWVPDEATEALRTLRRHRDSAKEAERRARQQLAQFLLRSGQHPPAKVKPWTIKYVAWLEHLSFAEVAMQRTLRDLIDEVEHQHVRVVRLEAELAEHRAAVHARYRVAHGSDAGARGRLLFALQVTPRADGVGGDGAK